MSSTDPDASQTDISIADAPAAMPPSSPPPVQTPSPDVVEPVRLFTPSERIQQLNNIDMDITKLLEVAGLAIQSLSIPSPDQKTIFANHTKTYHALLSSVVVNIKRQTLALEQADIQIPQSVGWTGAGASNVGSMDVGAINGRSDIVGRTMEAKLWREARAFVEHLEEGEKGVGEGDDALNGEGMQVDTS